jgi:hypothetical protein
MAWRKWRGGADAGIGAVEISGINGMAKYQQRESKTKTRNGENNGE